ncbi:MAG: M56 family metallopeptidase [Clostridiaceae bacterium]
MEELFLSVLNMSLTASYVIIFVMLARLPLKKAPKVISYALWAVVAFRLLCPFSFESMFSLLPASTAPIPQDIAYQQNPQINSGITVVDTFVNNALPSPSAAASVNPLQIYTQTGAFIWILGIAVMLVYSIASVLILKIRLKSKKHTERNIYEDNNLKTPFVLGIFRPIIYIPAGLTAEEKSYIITHEQTHIRRFDHIVKPFAFLVLGMHWFNPLAWIAFLLMSTDMELSCDEKVIKEMGDKIKKPYAESLLSLALGKHVLNGSPLAFGEGNVKGRIRNVLNYKKPAFWLLAAVVIAVITVGIGLLSNPLSNIPAMKWAKSLTLADVQSIELVVQPSNENERYKKYEPEEFLEIIDLVNQSRGKLDKNPEGIVGEAQTFYITTKDGLIHEFLNNGNRYLMIDGNAFESGYDWLNRWNFNGNTSMPDGFWERVYGTLTAVGINSQTDGSEPTSNAGLAFKTSETDLIKIGTVAFDEYMSTLANAKTPDSDRIASYKLNDISVLAGDINEFCVSMNYGFMTDSDSYINPGCGAKGKGTWPNNYMEIRLKKMSTDGYGIVSIGTGGGGQGLVPYAPQQTTLEPASPEWSSEQIVGVDMARLNYASDDIVIFHGYFGLFVYDLNTLQIIRSLDLKPLNCHQTQGDDACDVSVSMDGNTVQLHPMSSKYMYVYTVSSHTLQKTTYQPMKDRFSSRFVPIEDVIGSQKIGNYSYDAVKFDTGEYGYLHTSDWTLGTLSYVRDDMMYALFDIKEN